MKFTLSWLKEHLDTQAPLAEIAERLTMLGLEVEGIEDSAADFAAFRVGEVLSADAFARFEEEGLFNPQIGQDFLNEILEVGGSREAMESFKAFRGREPDIEALLRHNGLAA